MLQWWTTWQRQLQRLHTACQRSERSPRDGDHGLLWEALVATQRRCWRVSPCGGVLRRLPGPLLVLHAPTICKAEADSVAQCLLGLGFVVFRSVVLQVRLG